MDLFKHYREDEIFIEILKNNSSFSQKAIKEYLSSIQIADNSDEQADSVHLSFTGQNYYDLSFFKIGDVLEIFCGYKNRKNSHNFFGKFSVSKIEFSKSSSEIMLNISALSSFPEKMKTQKTEDFKTQTLKDILEQKAQKNNLKLKFDNTLELLKNINETQKNESDSNFLYRLAQKNNANLKVTQETILFYKNNYFVVNNKIPTVKLNLQDLSSFNIVFDGSNEFNKVLVSYYNVQKKDYGTVVAELEETSTNEEKIYEHQIQQNSKEEAQILANNLLRKIRLNSSKINISLPFEPNILSSGKVIINNFLLLKDKELLVKNVSHNITASSLITNVELEENI